MNYLQQAQALQNEMVAARRYFHQNAEIGFDLPLTLAYIEEKLTEMEVPFQKIGKAGIVATLGKGERCVLLRADMDALPMMEDSGVEFASVNGNTHSCGHDMHAAMLLGACKMLKQNEDGLPGVVKLLFQPAEEILGGAADCVAAGVLQNPKVDAAFAAHIMTGEPQYKVGTAFYSRGPALYSGDACKIEVIGKASHGSSPYMGIDAINIAAHIVLALNEIISREIPADEHSVVLVGKINGGLTVNTTPGSCTLEVSVRTTTQEKREFLLARVEEIAVNTAKVFRGEAIFTHVYGMGPLVCDENVADLAGESLKKVGIESTVVPTSSGTEDFTAIAAQVPAVMVNLGAAPQGVTLYPHHNPKMVADEAVMPYGAAAYVQFTFDFLNQM
ncbi:MAG: amidohydrolase [Oscillospiraceae bacterium]|nr:amidohydrolase [Oscillospiraceae bacterium]